VRHPTSETQQLLSCLVCLLILVASIDRVPDPPAVKRHHDAAVSLTTGTHHLPVVNQDLGSELFLSDLSGQARSFHSSFFLDQERLLPSAINLDQATDSSPPRSAS